MTNHDIEMQPVTSSNIKAIGYEHESLRLRVEFLNGTVYLYRAVPQDTAEALLAAPSVGKYFNAFIKGQYSSEAE